MHCPQFYYIKVACTGVYITRTCYHDGIFHQLIYFPCMRTDIDHRSETTSQHLGKIRKANTKPLSTDRVKRSISGKSASSQKNTAQRKLDLAARLRRLGRKSVKTMNAYFGLIQTRKPTKGKLERTHGKREKPKDNKRKESTEPVSNEPIISDTRNGRTTTEKPTTAVRWERRLMLPGVRQ